MHNILGAGNPAPVGVNYFGGAAQESSAAMTITILFPAEDAFVLW